MLFALLLGSAERARAIQLTLDFPTFFCGSQVVPPVDSNAFGGGTITVDTVANTLSYRIAFAELSSAEAAAHIHLGEPGVNGGVLFNLPLGNPKVGVWNYPPASEADILAGKLYIDIHTVSNPGGEIRSQVAESFAFLDGAQETPAVATTAYGVGVFRLNTDLNQLKYYIVTDGLTGAETAAHIHGFALHGTPAGVLHNLPAGNPKSGTWTYTEDQEEALINGQTYVNVHTTAFPGGEIRGQIVPMAVPLDGGQEVPGTGSTAAGMGLVALDPVAHALSYYVWVGGLTGAETAAHIHGFAPPGVNAGVLQGLPLGTRKLGVWNFGAANQAQVLAGLTYFNVHTTAFPGGEIRGQLVGFYHLTASDVPETTRPEVSQLLPSIPNPSPGRTEIRLDLVESGWVRLGVFDAQGRVVRDLLATDLAAGPHSVFWNGLDNGQRRVARGNYRYVLRTRRGVESGEITLLSGGVRW